MAALLLFGGTFEARALEAQLRADARLAGFDLVVSQRHGTPRPGLRLGGFGGAEGLVAFCQAQGVVALVDATHPFAARMQGHVWQVAQRLSLPAFRLERAPWDLPPELSVRHFPDRFALVNALQDLAPSRIFAPLGAQALSWLGDLKPHQLTVRLLDPHAQGPQPSHVTLIAGRGPFKLEDERALIRGLVPDLMLAKNSGGPSSFAKIQVAAELGLPVWFLDPPTPTMPPSDRFRSQAGLVEALVKGIEQV